MWPFSNFVDPPRYGRWMRYADEIREEYEKGYSLEEVGEAFGVSAASAAKAVVVARGTIRPRFKRDWVRPELPLLERREERPEKKERPWLRLDMVAPIPEPKPKPCARTAKQRKLAITRMIDLSWMIDDGFTIEDIDEVHRLDDYERYNLERYARLKKNPVFDAPVGLLAAASAAALAFGIWGWAKRQR